MRSTHWVKQKWRYQISSDSMPSSYLSWFSAFYFLRALLKLFAFPVRKFGIEFDTDVWWEWIAATVTATAREYSKVFMMINLRVRRWRSAKQLPIYIENGNQGPTQILFTSSETFQKSKWVQTRMIWGHPVCRVMIQYGRPGTPSCDTR